MPKINLLILLEYDFLGMVECTVLCAMLHSFLCRRGQGQGRGQGSGVGDQGSGKRIKDYGAKGIEQRGKGKGQRKVNSKQ